MYKRQPINTPIASSSLGEQAGDSLQSAPGPLAGQVITMPPTAELLQDTIQGTIFGAPAPMALPAPNTDGTLATTASSGMFGWIMAAGTGIANMVEDTPMADGGLAPANPDDDPKDIFDREMEVSELLSRRYREEAQDCVQQRNEIRRQAEIMADQNAEMQRKCTAEVEELRRMTAMHCQSNDAFTMSQLQQARDSAQDAQAIANNRVASLEVICQQRDASLASEFDVAIVTERQRALDAVAVERNNADRLRNDIIGLQEAAAGYQRTIEALRSNNASQQSAIREQIEGDYRQQVGQYVAALKQEANDELRSVVKTLRSSSEQKMLQLESQLQERSDALARAEQEADYLRKVVDTSTHVLADARVAREIAKQDHAQRAEDERKAAQQSEIDAQVARSLSREPVASRSVSINLPPPAPHPAGLPVPLPPSVPPNAGERGRARHRSSSPITEDLDELFSKLGQLGYAIVPKTLNVQQNAQPKTCGALCPFKRCKANCRHGKNKDASSDDDEESDDSDEESSSEEESSSDDSAASEDSTVKLLRKEEVDSDLDYSREEREKRHKRQSGNRTRGRSSHSGSEDCLLYTSPSPRD